MPNEIFDRDFLLKQQMNIDSSVKVQKITIINNEINFLFLFIKTESEYQKFVHLLNISFSPYECLTKNISIILF